MRRWFELGELDDTTYASKAGAIQWLQLPQKSEFIAWLNSMVGVNARLTKGTGDAGVCWGIGDGSASHVIVPDPGLTVVSAYGELRGQMLFQGVPPVFQGLCRQYFEKPGINDGPNESQTVEKPRGGTKSSGSGGATLNISLKSYLLLLLDTWQGSGQAQQTRSGGSVGGTKRGFAQVPQRWIDWLTLLIKRYDRYSPTQIYGWLAQIDFAANPPKL